MKSKALASIAILALGLAGASNAATYNYAFTSTGGNVTSVGPLASIPGGGPTVTVTPYSYDGSSVFGSAGSNGARITQNGSLGFGVNNGHNDNSHTIDNSGYTDMLLFSFSGSVSFSTITIGYVSGDSDFRYWVGASGSTAASLFGNGSGGTDVNGGSSPASYNISGTGFNLLVAARPGQSNDAFKINGLSVTTNSNIPGTPDAGSTVALLGLALAGLGFAKRRFGT